MSSMAAVTPEAEQRGRRWRLIIIVVVAVVILGGFLVFGRLRSSALDDKSGSAMAQLGPAWRKTDLARLSDSYSQATVDANASGDYSAAFKLFPRSRDATFVSADMSNRNAIAARYSIETWAGDECLDVVARAPVPNRVTFTTSKGC